MGARQVEQVGEILQDLVRALNRDLAGIADRFNDSTMLVSPGGVEETVGDRFSHFVIIPATAYESTKSRSGSDRKMFDHEKRETHERG